VLSRRILLAGVVAGVLCLYALALWWGELNQDEGWYLYAGRLVSEGQVPYRDFVSTQGPVMAYVYGWIYPLVRGAGVLGGRLFTVLLGCAGLALAGMLARCMAVRRGHEEYWPVFGVLVFGGLNLYQVYFTTIVKTYALAVVCLLAGLVLLERALALAEKDAARGRGWGMLLVQSAGGGVLLALAGATRLSALLLLPACWLPIALRWWWRGRPLRPGIWLAGLLAGGTIGVLATFGPFLLMAPEGLYFGLLAYHAGRSLDGWPAVLLYKAGFGVRLVQAYWPFGAMLVLTALRGGVGPGRIQRGRSEPVPWTLPLWTCFSIVTLVHVLSGFPYDDYQVLIMPVAFVAGSLSLGRWFAGWNVADRVRVQWAGGVALLLLFFSLTGPLLQGWVLAPRDRIWWPVRSESSLGQLRRVGAMLREGRSRAAITGTMLTQDTYVAVESGYRVPAGMEMGPFSNFVDLEDDAAARLGVLNRAGLRDTLLRAQADWAVYSGYGFAIQVPAVLPLPEQERLLLLGILQERFAAFAHVPAFGQAMTDLQIYRRRE